MNQTKSKDGTSINYSRSGEGNPLILVDGALCSMQFGPMPKLARFLSSHFTVIMYDRRGRGESGNAASYDVDREVEDIAALIYEAGGTAYLFGISSGAALGLKAASAGLNIQKLVMYEPPFLLDEKKLQYFGDHKANLERFIASGGRGEAVTYFMTKMVGVPSMAAFIMRLMPVWSKLKAVAHTLPYDAAIMGDFKIPAQLAASIKIPTQVMDGAKSPAGMRNAVKALADCIPGAKYVTLEGQTHNVSPEVLAPALIEFFKG